MRALHTLFTLRGIKAFLDMEYTGDLGSLEEIVAASKLARLALGVARCTKRSPRLASPLSCAVPRVPAA